MNTSSNQGPPDLDVVFRQLFSFLFKKRNRRNRDPRRIEQEQHSFKRLIERGKEKHLEKKRESGRAVTSTGSDSRAQVHKQRQRSETKAESSPRVDAVNSKTENSVAQHITALQRSQVRRNETIKADKTLKQKINASSTREWLHDSRTLRQAFVLKELLEPPVALRKRDRRRFS